MRLSEAMMLGSTTCRMEPTDINSCALGAALNALGATQTGINRYTELRRRYPWLENENYPDMDRVSLTYGMRAIWQRFDCLVCEGKMTFEQLVDFVRSIEPPEPEELAAPAEIHVSEAIPAR